MAAGVFSRENEEALLNAIAAHRCKLEQNGVPEEDAGSITERLFWQFAVPFYQSGGSRLPKGAHSFISKFSQLAD